MTTSYFQELLRKDRTLAPDVDLDCIIPKVTELMNEKLCAPSSEEEVSNVLSHISPLKAPGMDGFPAWFHQCS
jgi:hypothetical protein